MVVDTEGCRAGGELELSTILGVVVVIVDVIVVVCDIKHSPPTQSYWYRPSSTPSVPPFAEPSLSSVLWVDRCYVEIEMMCILLIPDSLICAPALLLGLLMWMCRPG